MGNASDRRLGLFDRRFELLRKLEYSKNPPASGFFARAAWYVRAESVDALQSQLDLINAELEATSTDGEPRAAASCERIPWTGTDVDFVDLMIELWEKGHLKADSKTDLLRTVA